MPNSLNELKQLIVKNKAVLVYFSATNCLVCEVLKPKVKNLFDKEFPNIKQIYISSGTSKEITSNYGIFSFPTILVFFEEKEFFRVNRNLSIDEFKRDIKRVYELLFRGEQ